MPSSSHRRLLTSFQKAIGTVGVSSESWKTIIQPEDPFWIPASAGRGLGFGGSRHAHTSGTETRAGLCLGFQNGHLKTVGWSSISPMYRPKRESQLQSDNSTNKVPKAITSYTQADKLTYALRNGSRQSGKGDAKNKNVVLMHLDLDRVSFLKQ